LLDSKYQLPVDLALDLRLLYEVRHEIIHPAHLPAGTWHNTPESMVALRERRLLQSVDKPDVDYDWIAQLQSHALFRWACTTIEKAAEIVLTRHQPDLDSRRLHLETYSRHSQYDAQYGDPRVRSK
jgi:hypothetical protein